MNDRNWSTSQKQIEATSQNTFVIEQNISLKDKNWFNTGGCADYFCQPHNALEFQGALQFAKQQNIKIFLLGKGANILISDSGVRGLTIQPQLTFITHQSDDNKILVTAGAGVDLHTLITYCLDNNIVGLEEFSGIPSTVGGAVYINLHYFEFLLEHFLYSAQVIHAPSGNIENVDKSWFNFGYNQSRLHQRDYYLVSATFLLRSATELESAFARGRHTEIIRHRAKRYPQQNTCGSFFRNFYPHEVEHTPDKKIFVAYYLDKLGVKGTQKVGGAIVSHQHANMLVNQGNATSSDIISLARTLQELMRQEFNLIPQPECQLIGFESYPLL